MQFIKNIGILAHVDAGKTTVTEQLLYQSGSIRKAGRVDHGTTVTDSMEQEKARGITIRTNAVSLEWKGQKINLIDTPGHMDFVAEVERVFGILDGAVLIVSAKEGVQSQTKAIFHHLHRLRIPTLILINKIDRSGAHVGEVQRQIHSMLTANILPIQEIDDCQIADQSLLHDDILTELVYRSPYLQERFLNGQAITEKQLKQSLREAVNRCTLYPVLYASALKGEGIGQLLDAMAQWLPCYKVRNDSFSGYVYKVDRDDALIRRSFVKIRSGHLGLRDAVSLNRTGETLKITALQTLGGASCTGGDCGSADKITAGDIAVIPYTKDLQIGDILGDAEIENFPEPASHAAVLKASVTPAQPDQRPALLHALAELTEEDPVLGFTIDGEDEVTIQVLGETQKEVVQSLLEQRYHIKTEIGNLKTIFMEQPKSSAEAVVHMAVPPNPYWASIGLLIEPLPLGSGIRFQSKVSLGYLNQSFQNAVQESVLDACKHGLYGWALTDTSITFTYGKYFSPVSTPSDFRHLAPYVLEMALRKAGTYLLEPVCSYVLEVPDHCTGKALHDMQIMRGTVERIDTAGCWQTLSGTVPLETARNYLTDLVAYTSGTGIFLTQHKGYQAYYGDTRHSGWQYDAKDQLRHQFLKAF